MPFRVTHVTKTVIKVAENKSGSEPNRYNLTVFSSLA